MYLYKTLLVATTFIAQQSTEEWGFLPRFSQSFREGRPGLINVATGIVLLLLVLGVIYVLIWLWNRYQPAVAQKKKIGVLESLKENYELSQDQNKYLSALIEKFKNRNPYDPEIDTHYLEKFLLFMVQNLSHGPQTLRRKKYQVPDLQQGEEIEIMFQAGNYYRTLECQIYDQDEKFVTVKFSPGETLGDLAEGDEVSVSYPQRSLNLRGDAEVRHIMDDRMIIRLIQGLHFEEKRIYKRIETEPIPCKLILQAIDGPTMKLQGTIQDISLGGSLIATEATDEELRKDMRGHVEFELPGYQSIDLKLHVVHVEKLSEEENGSSTWEIGVKFLDVGMTEREILHKFVQSRHEGDEVIKQEKSN